MSFFSNRLQAAQIALNVLGVIVLVLFVLLVSPALINSDSASGILLANDLVRTGSLLSKGWVYVSDSLTLDGRVQVAMLGALFWGTSVKTFIFTAAVGAAFAAWTAYSLARLLGASRYNAATASLVLLLGPSLIYQDLVVGLSVSMQMGLVLLFVASCVRYAFRGKATGHLLIALAIVLLMSTSSPKKAIAYLVLPMLATGVALPVLQWMGSGLASAARNRVLLVLPMLLLVAAAGHLWHAHLLQGLSVNASYAKLQLALTPDHVVHNLKLASVLYVRFAGAKDGLFPLLAVTVTSLALLVGFLFPLLPSGRRLVEDGREPGGKPLQLFASATGFVYLFVLAGTLAIALYILSYDQIKVYYGIYYLLIPLCPLAAVAACVSTRSMGLGGKAVRVALLAMLVVGIANSVSMLMTFPKDYFGISKNQKTTHAEKLVAIQWLRSHGVHHGFANYWDANALTLLSDGQVEVTSALTPAGGKVFRRHSWLASEQRINYVPHGEKWFVAIPVRRGAVSMPPGCLPADEQVTVGGYRIFLYRQPPAGCLPAQVGFGKGG